MKISRRTALVILTLGLVLLVGIIFRQFILDVFVTPLAVVFWLFWRLAITVDQAIYWGFLILAILAYLAVNSQSHNENIEQSDGSAINAVLENVKYWQMAIGLNFDDLDRPNILKSNLGKLLATVYTLKQPGTTFMEIYEQLKSRQLDVPEKICAFLFPETKIGGRRPIMQVLRSLVQAPARWLRHWSGRDVAEYNQMIAEVITFMESLMEMDHDDTNHVSPTDH